MSIVDRIKQFFVVEDDEETTAMETDGDEPIIKSRRKGSLVSLSNPRRFDLVLMEPTTLAEAQEVGERLRNRCAVIVNLQHTDKDIAIRIIDFISGITCALKGTAQKVTDWVFVFAPSHVEVAYPPAKEKKERNKKEQLYFTAHNSSQTSNTGLP